LGTLIVRWMQKLVGLLRVETKGKRNETQREQMN